MSKMHAGVSGGSFLQILRGLKKKSESVAIIQMPSSLANDPTLQYGLNLLEKTANKIVNWSMMPQRQQFIEQCVQNSKISA